MLIKKLKLVNFKCFEDFEIDFHDKLTVIIGGNGTGKTSILEGAAIALSSMFAKMNGVVSHGIDKTQAHKKFFAIGSNKDVQEQYPVVVAAEAEVDGTTLVWSRKLNSSKGQTTTKDAQEITELGSSYRDKVAGGQEIALPMLAYYGTGRLWDYHREKQDSIFKVSNRMNGYLDCVDGTANLKLMMKWFMQMTIEKYQKQEIGLGAIPELEAVYAAMEACYQRITGCHGKVAVQYKLATKELEISYPDEQGNMVSLPISQLSDGYKCTISLVADIAYRMAVLNPQFLGEVCEKTAGIILIDEVDLHLHPRWQQRILEDLQAIFPRVQFIVTTHAPAVIGSVKSECLRILNNFVAEQAPGETYGNDVNSILQQVMGVAERTEEVAEKFAEFYSLLQQKQFQQAGGVLDEIARLRDYHDEELAGCRVQLQLEKIRGGHK